MIEPRPLAHTTLGGKRNGRRSPQSPNEKDFEILRVVLALHKHAHPVRDRETADAVLGFRVIRAVGRDGRTRPPRLSPGQGLRKRGAG